MDDENKFAGQQNTNAVLAVIHAITHQNRQTSQIIRRDDRFRINFSLANSCGEKKIILRFVTMVSVNEP